jgi:hypothetical protein
VGHDDLARIVAARKLPCLAVQAIETRQEINRQAFDSKADFPST